MANIFLTILPLFLTMGVGSLLRIFKLGDDSWVRILNSLAAYVFFPALILRDLVNIELSEQYSFFLSNLLLLVGFILVLFFLTKIIKLKREVRNVYILAIFGNVAYLGYPFIQSVFPEQVSKVSFVMASYIIIVFTLGLGMISSQKKEGNMLNKIWNIIKNPLLLSTVLGIVLSQLNVILPVFIDKTLNILAGAASPVTLVALGMFIVRKIEFDKSFVHVFIITGIKLLILPIVFLVYSRFYPGDFSVAIVEAAMPAAVTLFALTETHELDKKVTMYFIVVSTIISLVTLPIISLFFV